MASSYVNALNQEETPVVQNAAQQSQTQQSTPYTEALTSATNQAAAQSQTAGTTPTVQQTATYIDDSGNKQTGYVSVLANDDDLTYWQRMEKFYNDQYEAAKASNDAAAKAKYAAAMEQINRKIEALNETYAGTNRQLYRDYMNNQRILPQQMAAMGYSGGLTESSNVRLRNSYEEALAENERSKAGQIADLNAQGVQYQYDADAEAARLNAEADQQRRSYLAALLQQEREEGIKQAREVGDTTGDYSRLLQYGYTQAEVNAFKKAWIQANPELAIAYGYVAAPKASSSGGSYYGGSTKKDTTSSGSDGSGITIDYASINNLGMGPISADYLSRQVESGRVNETLNNGVVSYSMNQNWTPAPTLQTAKTVPEITQALRNQRNSILSALSR